MKRALLFAIIGVAMPVLAQKYPPVLLLDGAGNPYPFGNGAQLHSNPPIMECYTNATGIVQPCNFSGGGGGNPGGSNGDIQYNNNGTFGGSAATITAGGSITIPSGQSINLSSQGPGVLFGGTPTFFPTYPVISDEEYSPSSVGSSTQPVFFGKVFTFTPSWTSSSTIVELIGDFGFTTSQSTDSTSYSVIQHSEIGAVAGGSGLIDSVIGGEFSAVNQGTGSVTQGQGLIADCHNLGLGTVTECASIDVNEGGNAPPDTGPVTTAIGVKIDGILEGSTNYDIWATDASALNRFDGLVMFPITESIGTQTISGCSLTSAAGGASTGSFHSGTNGTCTVTITPGITAAHGFYCAAQDTTTVADTLHQTATGATSCIVSGTTASGDVITWTAAAF